MGELRVEPWARYGQRRLYVNASDGESLGWYDQRTGEVRITCTERQSEVHAALATYLAGARRSEPVARAGVRPPDHSKPAPEPGPEAVVSSETADGRTGAEPP